MAEPLAGNGAEDDDLPLPDKSRLAVARDIVVFQGKLFVDGLRDVLLSPISLVVGLIGIFISRQPGEPFYRLLRLGRATEVWLDLFGDAYPDRVGPEATSHRKGNLRDLEQHLRALEKSLAREDYDQGARDSAARMRESLQRLRSKRKEQAGDTDDTTDSPR